MSSELKRYSPIGSGLCVETEHGPYALYNEAMDAIESARAEELKLIADHFEAFEHVDMSGPDLAEAIRSMGDDS